jgi:K+-transporting ATPase A subunit
MIVHGTSIDAGMEDKEVRFGITDSVLFAVTKVNAHEYLVPSVC